MITIIVCDVIIFIMGLIVGFVISDSRKSKKISDLKFQLQSAESCCVATNAELEGQKLARKEQMKKYDELYAHMLAVNAHNVKLQKKLGFQEVAYPKQNSGNVEDVVAQQMNEKTKAQLLSKSFSVEMGQAVYNLFLRGATRKDLAKRFGVSYPHICKIIRTIGRKQDPLF